MNKPPRKNKKGYAKMELEILNRWRNQIALRDLETENPQRSEQRADQEQDRTGEESEEAPGADVQWRI
jgi:hypothetical protein